MGFWSSIGSFVSSAASWVGSALSASVEWAGKALTTMVSVGGEIVKGVVGVANELMHNLGIFRQDDPPLEDWGDRAMQAHAQQIFPEQFENFSDYLDTLRNFEIDPKKTLKTNDAQKTLKGLEIAGRALEDRFNAPEGSMANVWLLAGSNPEYFTSKRFESIFSAGMDIRQIADYFQGRIGGAEMLDVEDQLVNIDQRTNPGKSESESRKETYSAAEASQEYLRNIER